MTRNPADVAGRMLIFTWISVLIGAAAGWPSCTLTLTPARFAGTRGVVTASWLLLLRDSLQSPLAAASPLALL